MCRFLELNSYNGALDGERELFVGFVNKFLDSFSQIKINFNKFVETKLDYVDDKFLADFKQNKSFLYSTVVISEGEEDGNDKSFLNIRLKNKDNIYAKDYGEEPNQIEVQGLEN